VVPDLISLMLRFVVIDPFGVIDFSDVLVILQLNSDAIHRGGGQIIPTCCRVCYGFS
jgi:hypothetical protein